MRLGTRAGVRLHRQPLSLRAVCIPTCRIRPGTNGFFSTRAVRILSILKKQPDGAYDPFACRKLSLGISWP
ncbi:hypothetical protein [Schaedlerella arabinosiphila]|uniref:hypothetical protein n=1 Tax=Schaedlerella arabinosiphila TaxID=2044587 RepID=UPI002558153B|nr:hypothetical protein [Schaedlerella arabinosiphila]MCI9633767.1 hypothetical protein [Ruminococcus sp.]